MLERPACSHFASQVVRRRQDCDTTKRMQIQQVAISSDQDVGAPVHGCFQKLVVLRITARPNGLLKRNDFHHRRQPRQQSITQLA